MSLKKRTGEILEANGGKGWAQVSRLNGRRRWSNLSINKNVGLVIRSMIMQFKS